MKRTALLLVFALLLLASPVLADLTVITYPVDDTFSVLTGTDSLSLCQCESYADKLVVTNTGVFASQYAVTASSGMVSLSERSFELLPGESKTVYAFINAPCDDELSESLSFVVEDLFGNRYAFEKPLVVGKCQNLEASLIVDVNGSVSPCSPVVYDVYVKNTGVFAETYDVWFGGDRYEGYFGTPYQTLILPPGGSGTASSSLLLDCSMHGSFTVPFTVAAQRNGLVARLSHELEVVDDYGFALDASVDDVCASDWTLIAIEVTNDAPFENTFWLSLDAPVFFSLQDGELTLGPGESGTAAIGVYAADADVGSYEFSLTATGAIGRVSRTLSANLSVLSCYGASVNVDLPEDIAGCSGYHEYPVVLKNTGSTEQGFVVSVNGSEFASLDVSEFVLGPGQSADFSLVLDVPPDLSLDADIVVRAELKDRLDVFGEDSIGVSFVDEYACYQPGLWYDRVRLSDQAGEFLLVMGNTGFGSAEYDLSLDAPSFLSLDGSTGEFLFAPGERGDVRVFVGNGSSLGVHEGFLVAEVVSVDGDRVLTYSLPFSLDIRGKSVFLRAYESVGSFIVSYPCHFVSVVLLFLVVLGVLILLLRPRKDRLASRGLLFWLLGLWLLAVVVFLLVQGLPQSLHEPVFQDADDPLLVRMAEDSSYVLDLSSYFVDPDDDVLVFTVEEMDDVSVVVENGSATFFPDRDWSGTRRFRITAYDGFGGVTESPRLVLEVVPRDEYGVGGVYAYYCGYANLLLLLGLAIVIWLLARPVRRVLPPVAKKQARKK